MHSEKNTPLDATSPLPYSSLFVMGAAIFAAITTEVLPVGLLPVVSAGLHSSESRVGLLVSAYAVVVAIGSIPLSIVLSRWPRRQVLVGILLLYALSNVIFASADNYWVALGARLLGGLAHAGFFSVVIAGTVSMVHPSRVGRAIAIVTVGQALGFALGVPIGTAIGIAVGWRWTFVGCALIMVALAILAAVVLPSLHVAPTESADMSIAKAVRSPAMLVVAGVVAFVTLGHYTAYTYFDIILRHAHVASGSFSTVLFVFGLTGIVGLFMVSVVVDRHPRSGLLLSIAVVVLSLLVIGVQHTTDFTIGAVAVWGLAFGGLSTLIQAVALRAVPNSPDAAPAVVNCTFNIGIAGGALIGSRELLVGSAQIVALTGAGIALCSFVLLAWSSAQRVRSPRL